MDRIELTAEDKNMFAVRVARMNAYKQLAQAEEADISRLLQKIYKIPQGENWNFDLEMGVLTRVSDPKPEQLQ